MSLSAKSQAHQDALIEEFISAFPKLDEMADFSDIYPIVAELAVGERDGLGRTRWRPLRLATDTPALESLYTLLPARFPPLFERLVLSYRWAQVDLRSYTLLANPPGPGLSRLQEQLAKDPAFWESLRPAGYIQFAKGPDMNYDPVCFDVKRRKKNHDCPVVKIDHEEILCNNRIKVVKEVASSFEELVLQTIREASERHK